MDEKPAQPDALLRWMEVLGDASRLRMLRLLERHELGVAELGDVLQLPQSTISRHLKLLHEQGWLRSRRVGTAHLSTLADDASLGAARRRLWTLAREQTAEWASMSQDELRLQRLLRERSDDSRRFFTGAAGEWDRLRSQLYGSQFTTDAMLALLPRSTVVADLGCGTGQTLERLAPFVRRAVGIDNTPAMLKAARKRLEAASNVELLQGELENLPMEDASVDAALMVLALSYVAEPATCVRELARILRPGGRAVVVDITAHDRDDFRREMGQTRLGFSTEEIRQLMLDAHLLDPVVRPLPPEPSTRGPALLLGVAVRG